MSFVLGFTAMVLGAGDSPTQDVNAIITDVISVVIGPGTVTFGSVAQGAVDVVATSGPITFNAGIGANTNMTIKVTSVTGAPFAAGLKFDNENPTTKTFYLNCDSRSGVCVYTPQTTAPTLSVPVGFPASSPAGVITYLVTGITP